MICIKTDIPKEICDIDDELKAIYHSKDTICIWVFKTRKDRNKFMDETAGMVKNQREIHFESFYNESNVLLYVKRIASLRICVVCLTEI